MIVLGVENSYVDNAAFDAAIVDSHGAMVRRLFPRPPAFEGKGLAINFTTTHAARSEHCRFLASSIWAGIIRHRFTGVPDDTLFLPPVVFETISFPDTALAGATGLTDFAKAHDQITDLVALDDSTVFVTIRVWDYRVEESKFKIVEARWGRAPFVRESTISDARVKTSIGDTLIVLRGSVGDTIWVEKRRLAKEGIASP